MVRLKGTSYRSSYTWGGLPMVSGLQNLSLSIPAPIDSNNRDKFL